MIIIVFVLHIKLEHLIANVLRDIYNNSPYYFQSVGICVDSSQILVFLIFLCTGLDQEKLAELCISEYVG